MAMINRSWRSPVIGERSLCMSEAEEASVTNSVFPRERTAPLFLRSVWRMLLWLVPMFDGAGANNSHGATSVLVFYMELRETEMVLPGISLWDLSFLLYS